VHIGNSLYNRPIGFFFGGGREYGVWAYSQGLPEIFWLPILSHGRVKLRTSNLAVTFIVRSATTNALAVPPTRLSTVGVIGLFQSPRLGCGTTCQSQLHQQRLSTRFKQRLKTELNFSFAATTCRPLTHANMLYGL